jgi:hypothetical protein
VNMLCALTLLIAQAFCAPRIAAFIVPKFNVQNSLSRSIAVVGRQNVPFSKNIPMCKLVTEDKELSGVEAIGNESKLDSDWNKFAIAGVVSFL